MTLKHVARFKMKENKQERKKKNFNPKTARTVEKGLTENKVSDVLIHNY